jgi:hypothetical protein
VPASVDLDRLSADAFPPAGSETEHRDFVSRLLHDKDAEIRSRFPEVQSLTVGPGLGRAWKRSPNGEVSVVKVEDFAIHGHVRTIQACPAEERRNAWPRNIPLIFVVDPAA